MAIEFHCPICGGTLQASSEAVGQVVRCGGCLSMLRVPSEEDVRAMSSDGLEPSAPQKEPTSVTVPPASQSSDNPARKPTSGESRTVRRRRVRPEPAVRKGSSPLLWAVITICVVGFTFCVLCCGMGMQLQGEHWRTVESSEGGFLVQLPAVPRSTMILSGLKLDASWSMLAAQVLGSGDQYAVLYKEIVPSSQRQQNDERLLTQTVNDLTKSLGKHQVVDDEQVHEMCGIPCRELKYHSFTGEIYLFRIMVVETRMYVLIVGGAEGLPDQENIDHFFDSFTVTDANLLNLIKDRQESRKLAEVVIRLMDATLGQVKVEQQQAQVAMLGSAVTLVPLRRVALEERLLLTRVDQLGRLLGAAPLRSVAAEQELVQVSELGSKVAGITASEMEQERERLMVTRLGAALANDLLSIMGSEQLHVAEKERIEALGVAIGGATLAAILELKTSEEKP